MTQLAVPDKTSQPEWLNHYIFLDYSAVHKERHPEGDLKLSVELVPWSI